MHRSATKLNKRLWENKHFIITHGNENNMHKVVFQNKQFLTCDFPLHFPYSKAQFKDSSSLVVCFENGNV